ncbi:MAG: hypothetical protein AAF206_06985 [Bacteroidota bacterium]
MRYLSIILVLLAFSLMDLRAQSSLGFEFQAYPTGLIPGIRYGLGIGEKDELSLRIGYQWIRHGSNGVHEDERGDGGGFTLGYRHYFQEGLQGWFVGAKNDVWFNTLDWRDNIDQANELSGTSRIVVVQPTAEAGYLFALGESAFFSPSAAFGFEINASTNGAEVGQGAIFLLGFWIGKRF